MMEVTRRLITIALLGVTLLGSAEADIMIQPGYKQKNHETQVSDESEQTPTTQAPRQANSELAEEFDRYRSLHRAIEGQLVHLIHEQSSQNLQKSAPEVIAVPVNFRPRLIRPLQHRLGGSRSFYLTPAGPYGLYPGDYGYQSHPYRGAEEESSNQQDYAAARTQWTRSVDGGPGLDGDVVGEVQDVAAQSALNASDVDGIVQITEPEITVTDEDGLNKNVEARQIGHRDDAIVGSPLDRIHYENPRDNDQHHPRTESSEISSSLMRAASAVGNILDGVAPGVMNYENRNSASTMTHENTAPNYRHDSQYPPPSENGQRASDTSIWKASTGSPNSQPMTGQSYNSQPHSQNSGWSSIQPTQSSHAKTASGTVHYSQQAPAAYPALSNSMINRSWLTAMHGNHPSYQNYRPVYENHYGRPPVGSNRPHINGPWSYPGGTSSSAISNADNQSGFGSGPSPYNHGFHYQSGSTSSAAASANNNPGHGGGHYPYNYGSPYANSASAVANSGNFGYSYPYRTWSNNPYGAQNSHASSNIVDQFGRALFNLIPSSFNSLSVNPANYKAYLGNFVQNQIPEIYRHSGYWH